MSLFGSLLKMLSLSLSLPERSKSIFFRLKSPSFSSLSFPTIVNDTKEADKTIARLGVLGSRLGNIVKELDDALIKRTRNANPPKTLIKRDPNHTFTSSKEEEENSTSGEVIEVSHPWPEWIAFVDSLVQGNYFCDSGFASEMCFSPNSSNGDSPCDEKSLTVLAKGFSNFGRDRSDLISLETRKNIKESIRKLLHQIVDLSKLPLEKDEKGYQHPTGKVGRDEIEMRKGDWLCEKCEFMNFAKNKKCLQCGEHHPKRKLKPGEWECVGCGYINYRRNLFCHKCECNRPKESDRYVNADSIDDSIQYREWKWKWKKVSEEDEALAVQSEGQRAPLSESLPY
ncbi:uncharacterized protein LOC18423441 isoform X3 [Amborella trichopoda]|uniref:uncharacterized protein LOC18423441 isoform X3 n=1 Tax=Amborella trichopoda TaxID=13333 RepID=UPI0005D354DD|nr:uncharacterized protein LOC18423441 isoform X3 [Amborella trichopoda]|eukprot:XP_011626920.1 uncharacterized protein LOC18423441 isoform X3 [Amborella trichopoda]